ncbi:hypothetical protein ACFFRR_010944 [Megaselia abdita]
MKLIILFSLTVILISWNEVHAVTGGYEASLGQFPWHVIIYGWEKDRKTRICGGSIIDPKWVLTAASCIGQSSKVIISAGRVDIKDHNQGMDYRAEASDIILHSGFENRGFQNNIALIRVNETIAFNNYVHAVELETEMLSFVGELVTVTGFGALNDDKDYESSDILQYAELDVQSLDECRKYYSTNLVNDKKLCVSGYDGISACNGDNGGALVIADTNKQVAIFSNGRKACTKGYPTLWTRILDG